MKQLYELEEKIEQYYKFLAELENAGLYDSLEYNEYYKMIKEATKLEGQFLIANRSKLASIYNLLKKDNEHHPKEPLNLGLANSAIFERLLNMFEECFGDDSLDYVHALKYDINKILLIFLDELIHNPYFEEIRKELLFYKYRLIFINQDSENDFLKGQLNDSIKLKANNYHTNSFPIYPYLDQAILVLPIELNLNEIVGVPLDFKENPNAYSLMVIRLINILAHLSLCTEDCFETVYKEVLEVIHSEIFPCEAEELFNDLLEIFEQLKNRIQNWR